MPVARVLALLAIVIIPAASNAADKVDFARDIRPILSNNCFKCHGPAVQKAKLRLDQRDSAVKKGAITPGKPANSELLTRITPTDSDQLRMPPRDASERLTPEQIAKLKSWIENGAESPPHWAFVPPKRPAVPVRRDPNGS